MPGLTPNRSIRFPLYGEPGYGDVAMETMVRDLDVSYTASDTARSGAVHKPRAVVENTGTQSIAKGTVTQMAVNATIFDNANMSNIAGNGLLCRLAGYYYVKASGRLQLSATYTNFQIGVSRNAANTNGSIDFPQHKQTGAFNGGFSWRVTAWGMMQLAVNDTITSYVSWNGTPAGPGTLSHARIEAFMVSTL